MNKILTATFALLFITLPLFADDGNVENVEILSSLHFWDTATEALIDGNYLYVVTYESGVRILDNSDPLNPIEISFCKSLGAIDIGMNGEYLFVLCDTGDLDVYDVSIPENPSKIISHHVCTSPARLALFGDFIFVGDYLYTGDTHVITRILNVSDLNAITEVSQFDFSLIYLNDMKIHNDILAIAGYTGSAQGSAVLLFYNISNLDNIEFEGFVELDNFVLNLTLDDNRIVTGGSSGVSIYDISRFDDIDLICQVNTPDIVRASLLNENTLYAVGDVQGLMVYEISNPTLPVLVNQYFPEFNWSDIDLIEENLVLTGRSEGVQIVDLSDEDNLEILSSVGNMGKIDRVYINEDIVYLIGEQNKLRSVDISNPFDPEILCEIVLGENTNGSLTDIAFNDNYAFITTENMGMRVVDISDPSNLNELSSAQSYGVQNTIDIIDNIAYIGGDGLLLYDISFPLDPTLRIYNDYRNFHDILIRDEYLYFTNGGTSIYTMDISNPLYPSFEPTWEIPTHQDAYRLSLGASENPIEDTETLLASSNTNIFPIVSLSEPEYPFILGEYSCPGRTFEVVGLNEFVFTASYTHGLKIFNYYWDQFQLVGHYDSYFYATSIALANDYVLLGDTYGFHILDCQQAVGVNNIESGINPDSFVITKTYPNPFNPSLNVEIALPETARLNVSVYNINGQMVGQISNGVVNAGIHNLTFDGADLSSGVYFIQAEVPGYSVQTKKVVLMK